MPRHVVVREIGQLLSALVEGQRKFSAGIEVAVEDVRYGGAALLPGIPCLENRLAVGGLVGESHRRTAEVHEDNLLAGIVQRCDQIFLNLRKFDLRTVAALESGEAAGVALFAFKEGSDAGGEDDGPDAVQGGQNLVRLTFAFQMAAALHVAQVVAQARLQCRQQGDGLLGDRTVVAPHHGGVVGIGAYQRDALFPAERKDAALVLQEDHGLAGHLQRKCLVLRAFHYVFRKIRPGVHSVDFAQADTGYDDPLEIAVEFLLGQKAFLHRLGDGMICVPAFDVNSVLHCECGGLLLGLHVLVTALDVEVGDSPAVGDYHSPVTPFSAEHGVDQIVASAAGLALEGVVCGHHLLHVRLGHKVLECREIGLIEIPAGGARVEAVPVRFGPGVHGIMLRAGEELANRAVVRALQAAHNSHSHLSHQIGILPVGLHPAAPAGIAEDIDVRGPEGEVLIALVAALGICDAVLHAGLVAYRREHVVHQRIVEGRGHCYGHGEGGGGAVAPYSVQGLVPPVILLDAEARDGLGCVEGKPGLLFKCKTGDEVFRPLLGAEALVLERVGLRGCGGADAENCDQKMWFGHNFVRYCHKFNK